MQNVIIAWPSPMDYAEVTSVTSAASADFPGSNLLLMQPGDCWRSAGWADNAGLRVTQKIKVSLAQAASIDLVALISTNLSPRAVWRVYGGNDPDLIDEGIYGYDSGPMTDPSAASGLMATLDLDFANDNYTYGLPRRTNHHLFKTLSPAQTFRHWQFQIYDPTNVDGFIQVGRLYLARAYQPALNMDRGAGFGHYDPSPALRTRGGALRIDPHGISRIAHFDLSMASETEMRTAMHEIDAARGSSKDCLLIRDADQTTYLQQEIIYGVMRDLQTIIREQIPLYSKSYRFEELLP